MKKVTKSLSLTKETVSSLSNEHQNAIRGGNTLQVCGATKTMMWINTGGCGPSPCEEV